LSSREEWDARARRKRSHDEILRGLNATQQDVTDAEDDANLLDIRVTSLEGQMTTAQGQITTLEDTQLLNGFILGVSAFYSYFILSPPRSVVIDDIRIAAHSVGIWSWVFNVRSHATYMSGAAVDLFSVNQAVNAAGATLFTPDQNLTLALGASLWLKVISTVGANIAWGYTLRYH